MVSYITHTMYMCVLQHKWLTFLSMMYIVSKYGSIAVILSLKLQLQIERNYGKLVPLLTHVQCSTMSI